MTTKKSLLTVCGKKDIEYRINYEISTFVT